MASGEAGDACGLTGPARRTRRGAVAAVLVVVGLLVAGCGGFPDPVVIHGVSITKDVTTTLLADGEDVMSGLIRKTHASSDGPHCFVSLRSGTDDVANDFLRCGPVRVFGLPRDANWFSVPLSVHASGMVQVSPAAGSHSRSTPTALASDEQLSRPDGTEPGKPAAVPAPEPRQAEAGLMTLLPAASGVTMAAPKQPGLLLGPHVAVQLTRTGSGPTFGSGTHARGAAPGEEFVFAQLDPGVSHQTDLTTSGDESSLNSDVSWTVVAGSRRRPLETLDKGTLVVSVRKGDDVWLEADDKGRTERLNLRTGAREADPTFDPLYRRTNVVPIHKDYQGSVTDNDKYGTINMSVTVDHAVLTPYDDQAGYAPDGKVWLGIDLQNESQDFLVAKFSPRTYQLTVDGEPTRLTREGDDWLLAAVPPTLTRATLSVQGTGLGSSSSFRFDTPFTMKEKLTVDISLPR